MSCPCHRTCLHVREASQRSPAMSPAGVMPCSRLSRPQQDREKRRLRTTCPCLVARTQHGSQAPGLC